MKVHKVHYIPHTVQKDFHECNDFINSICAGYGYGKSFALVMKHLKNIMVNKGLPGGLLCPDLKMFRRDILPIFEDVCEEAGIPMRANLHDYTLTFKSLGHRTYVFHDQDRGASIRGPNLAFGSVNEVTLCSQEGFNAFIARMRLKKAKLLQVSCVGTPEGFDWFHEKYIQNKVDGASVFYGTTYENKHLNDQYVKNLEANYDELMRKQYLMGQAVSMVNRAAAWAFSRNKNVVDLDLGDTSQFPIWVSIDFNVDPMAATLFYRMPDHYPFKLYGFASLNLKNSNTPMLARAIKELTEGRQVALFPDPAGNHRDTRSMMTDIEILEEAGFHDIRFKKSITSVKDCLNAMNNQLDKAQILFSSECKDAIIDLERTSLRETGEIDKRDTKRSHWLDGIKNMIEYEFPIMKMGSQKIRTGYYA